MSRSLNFVLVATLCFVATKTPANHELLGNADRFVVFITSDPQYPYLDNQNDPRLRDYPKYTPDETKKANLSEDLITRKYEVINQFKDMMWRDGWPTRGIIVNGDLTAYGHNHELDKMKDLWWNANWDNHIFLGLGNHDYENNIGDCGGGGDWCADNMYRYMKDHADPNHNTPGLLTESLTQGYYRDQLNSYKLSLGWDWRWPTLWYNFKLGGVYHFAGNRLPTMDLRPGVRFIQLQNSADYEVSIGGHSNVEIKPDWVWLENELIEARRHGEPIILLSHKQQYSHDLDRMMRQYGVAATFSGHMHSSLGRTDVGLEVGDLVYKSSKTPFFKSGAAFNGADIYQLDPDYRVHKADGSFLYVKFDLVAEIFKVMRVGFYRSPDQKWTGWKGWTEEWVGDYPLYPVDYRLGEGQSPQFLGSKKQYLFSFAPAGDGEGHTIIRNNLEEDIHYREWCMHCKGGTNFNHFKRKGWKTVKPGTQVRINVTRSLDTTSSKQYLMGVAFDSNGRFKHGYELRRSNPDDPGDWLELTHKEPTFTHLTGERCIAVTEFTMIPTPAFPDPKPSYGYNPECEYTSE